MTRNCTRGSLVVLVGRRSTEESSMSKAEASRPQQVRRWRVLCFLVDLMLYRAGVQDS